MNLPEPNQIPPTAENIAFARAVARAHFGVPLPGEMPASRELDALVAEKVMRMGETLEALLEGDTYIVGTPAEGAWIPVPHYSTDIVAAWQVVEKLSCGFQLTYLPLLPEGWTASFFTETGEGIDRTARTAPLAICRAALAAVDH